MSRIKSVRRSCFTALLFALVFIGDRASAAPAGGLSPWGVGGSLGLANPVEHEFKIDQFKGGDANLWVQYELEEKVVLRATVGSLIAKGFYAGRTVSLGNGSLATAPDLKSRVDYGVVSVSYDFRESAWTSGLFAGLGVYRIRPESVAPEFAPYQDRREKVWGAHVGVDTDVRLWKTLSLLGRITLHFPQSEKRREILIAGAGLLYRF